LCCASVFVSRSLELSQRDDPITLTHNLTNYNTPPLLGIGAPSLGGELLDDTEPNLNPVGV